VRPPAVSTSAAVMDTVTTSLRMTEGYGGTVAP
jgi:hypothetical protein